MNPSVETARLERNAVGLAPTLFQSITHMAPAAAVAFSIIVGAQYAGGSLPLAVLFALVACLLVAISIGQLARHLPSAGGLYTYSSRGLHPYVGFLVAWGFILAEPIVAPLLYLIFGNELAANLNSHFGWPLWLWAPFAVVAGLIVWRRSDDALALFVSGFLVMFGTSMTGVTPELVVSQPAWRAPYQVAFAATLTALPPVGLALAVSATRTALLPRDCAVSLMILSTRGSLPARAVSLATCST